MYDNNQFDSYLLFPFHLQSNCPIAIFKISRFMDSIFKCFDDRIQKGLPFYPVLICFSFCTFIERKMTMQNRERTKINEYEYKMVSYANEKHPLIKPCVWYMKRTGFYIPFWCTLAHRAIVAQQTANKYSFVNFISLIPLSVDSSFSPISFSFGCHFFIVVVVVCAPLLLCNNSSSQKVRKLHVCGLHMRSRYNVSYEWVQIHNTTQHTCHVLAELRII